jgi:hypothetical protein
MNNFALSAEPIANNSHPNHKLFCQYPASALLCQGVYNLLIHNRHRRFTVEDVANLKNCSYLAAYRACRKLIKLGVARRILISWPISDSHGRESMIHRVGIEHQDWHKQGITYKEWKPLKPVLQPRNRADELVFAL